MKRSILMWSGLLWLIRQSRWIRRVVLILLLEGLSLESWWWDGKRVKDRGIRILSWKQSLRILVQVTGSRLIFPIRRVTTR